MSRIICVFLALSTLFYNCKRTGIDKNLISVSILPQKYFVEKIAGSRYKINVMVLPGHDPHTYEPSSRQMISLSNTAIYFASGHLQFEENFLENFKSINEQMKVYDTSVGIKYIGDMEQTKDHDEDSSDHHQHGVDPHFWLSPQSVKIIATNIYSALCKYAPAEKAVFTENYIGFIKEIESLDEKIKSSVKKIHNKKFIVFHPSWTYLARDYGLKQIPVEIDGKNPSIQQMKKIIDLARAENIKVIFVQKQLPVSNARSIAQDINGKILQLDPLAYNWKDNLIQVITVFKNELK